jgi:tetratricopeptide (TPR) repeat protein
MQSKPFVEKVANVPSVKLLQFMSADHKQLAGASLVMDVMMYFGGLMEQDFNNFKIPPDYAAMSRLIHASVELDPYNSDAYYFAQSILVWDVGQVKLANDLLIYGMEYREWDWTLPFFAGFNYAYVLKDFEPAARYYKIAGQLSGQPLFVKLAGRYMHEAGQTELAINYLSAMVKGARNPAIKKNYALRLEALQSVRVIERGRDAYRQQRGHQPDSLEELVQTGYLASIPLDPYGGRFYLEPEGRVNTTSKFAFKKKNQDQ